MNYILWTVPSLTIDQKLSKSVNSDTGEISFNFNGKGHVVEDIVLLYQDNGLPVSVVNNWLIYLKTSLYRKSVNTQAQALLHYFIFLDEIGLAWDEMPITSRNKPTYKFSKHLKDAVKNGAIARTTANNYLGSIVSFYKFYLSKGYEFINKPFNYKTIKVNVNGGHEFSRGKFVFVDSTDIRLNLPKDKSNFGMPRELVPLSEHEWTLVDEICSQGKVYSNTSKGAALVNLSEEFKLAVALARHTGLRREEIVTFRSKFIYKPTAEQFRHKYLIHSNGVHISPQEGVNTKGSGSRTIEMPSSVMLQLHQYINSKRYIKRRKLFEVNNPDELNNPPIFISQNGHHYASRTFNARWCEVRNTVKVSHPSFNHKFHNLRSTYAVTRLKELLNQGIKEGDALDYIQSVMGHKSRSTLLHYLKFCHQKLKANEVYEQALDLVLKVEE
ncbi:tyrosine-type recombinase/integrase [Pseudoalteromonas rhizosphaerae]|uniref:tyrosine-type recombinase/integrase n=1 Tax=Pseudoalteromonas rhizosphaerae TaxID=2518973 RepID=UPI0037049161